MKKTVQHKDDSAEPIKTVTGTDLEGRTRTLARSEPPLLDLFQTFLPQEGKYSNTIELYDAIPKYFPSTQKMAALRLDGKFLDTLERDFKHRGNSYKAQIHPARVEAEEGRFVEHYPTEREQLVEEALRKIAADGLSGVFLNDKVGVQFTLNQLMKELAQYNHSLSYASIIESLTICNRSNITVKSADGSAVLQSPIFPVVLIKNRKEWMSSPKDAYCYVQFNPLVTASLQNLTYRQFDYATAMRLQHPLVRWLHKRLSHHYVQASLRDPYTIKASTIIRDSGLVTDENLSRAFKAITACIETLKNPLPPLQRVRNRKKMDKTKIIEGEIDEDKYLPLPPSYTSDNFTILLNYREARVVEGKRLTDIVYTLTPSPFFIDEVKRANARQNHIEKLGAGQN